MGAQEIYLEAGIREGTINVLYIKSAGKSWYPSVQGCLRKPQSLVAWNQVATHTPQYSPLTHPQEVWLAVTAYGKMRAHTQNYKKQVSVVHLTAYQYLLLRGTTGKSIWKKTWGHTKKKAVKQQRYEGMSQLTNRIHPLHEAWYYLPGKIWALNVKAK